MKVCIFAVLEGKFGASKVTTPTNNASASQITQSSHSLSVHSEILVEQSGPTISTVHGFWI